MPDLPTGTVTFLFTDIESSTALLQHLGDRYADVLTEYRRLLRAAFREGGGKEIDTPGDACFAAFHRARDAVATTVAAQRTIARHPWPDGTPVRVRMGLHTGEPTLAPGGYVGLDVHRAARICAAGWGGQILLSRTTRGLVENELPQGVSLRNLGEHRLKDLQRPEQLFQVLHPDLVADFPPLNSLDTLPNNLPRQLTSFVGRDREIADVKRLLSTTRLLTVTGAGGAGKTRLALQVAADVLEDYAHGVWVVELAGLSDPALIPHAVAGALGIREKPGRSLPAAVTDSLQPRHVLLVLDNCEHLVAACARLAEALLRACPNLRMLATSRETLDIPGETAWAVPSLSLPEPGRLPPLEHLVQFEAVRLFVERTLAAMPGFTVTDRNAPAVVQVCHRLDGMPLAIELAAARTKVLSVEQIATRLDDRFRLLVAGSRTALPRHQTLRAAMDWSYDLLSEPERVVLRRLSVFAGGFTLEAAEEVCAGDGHKEADVLDFLANLVDKSLVLMDERSGGVRYRLLETVRQYGWGKLLDSGEAAPVRTRHRDWYLGLAQRAEPELRGPGQRAWLERLEMEHDNLRAAMAWTLEAGDAEAGLRLSGALWRFWDVRGYVSEGRRWLEAALNVSGDVPPMRRANVLNAAGLLASNQGDYASARRLLEESLAIDRNAGDRRAVAVSLHNLANVAREQGEYPTARSLSEESLAIRREIGDRRGIASSLTTLGSVARVEQDYPLARSCYEESLAIKRAMGDRLGMAVTLNNLGNVAALQGDRATARAFFEESLAIRRELGDRRGTGLVLSNLGNLAYEEGEYALARSRFVEALTTLREVGARLFIVQCFEGLAAVASAERAYARAARLDGAAEALREAIRAPLLPDARPAYERRVAAVRAAFGEVGFAAAWAEGRAMPLEQALAYALGPGTSP